MAIAGTSSCHVLKAGAQPGNGRPRQRSVFLKSGHLPGTGSLRSGQNRQPAILCAAGRRSNRPGLSRDGDDPGSTMDGPSAVVSGMQSPRVDSIKMPWLFCLCRLMHLRCGTPGSVPAGDSRSSRSSRASMAGSGCASRYWLNAAGLDRERDAATSDRSSAPMADKVVATSKWVPARLAAHNGPAFRAGCVTPTQSRRWPDPGTGKAHRRRCQ